MEKMQYSIEPRTRKHIKGYGFLSFVRKFYNKYREQLLDKGLNALKTVSKQKVHKAAEVTGEFIGNKIADAVAKSNHDKIMQIKPVVDENARNVEKIIISPEERE